MTTSTASASKRTPPAISKTDTVEIDALIDRWNRGSMPSLATTKPPQHLAGNHIRKHILQDDQ